MKTRKNPEGMTTGPDKNCRDKSQYVAGASTGSKEFLDEQCFTRALKGKYQSEFELVRARLTCLSPFQTVPEFMHALWNDKDLRESVTGQLKELWRADYDFRPTSGLILVLAMWRNAVAAGEDFWSDLFIGLAEESRNSAGSNSLITPCGLTASKRGTQHEV